MSSAALKGSHATKLGQGASNQNLRVDKLARTSTPDSDALASSDDEGDQRHEASPAVSHQQKPARRPSWLNDTTPTLPQPRKGSFASNSLSSPTTSHPSTPSAENGPSNPWGSHSASSALNRPGVPSFTWGTGIWNNDRKDPPLRLTEVLPSPTSTVPPGAGSNSFFGPDAVNSQTSPSSRDSGPNAQIPFPIPLHPTPKTYRSQSYSVGQLEPDTPTSNMSSSTILGRARHSGLQHRPSRPSMLSEMSNEGSLLGNVKEVEDDEDEDSMSGSMHSSFHQSAEAKTIEMLARENAMLRQQQQHQQQQQQQQQQYNARLRPRASTGAAYLANGYPAVPEESDYAVDELDEHHEGGDLGGRRSSQRRMSEYGANGLRSPMDGRKPENANLKKALWSSSPGLYGPDASQSRRHSFANMPTRQGSITSIADSVGTLDGIPPEAHGANGMNPQHPEFQAMQSAYFAAGGNLQNPGPSFNYGAGPPHGVGRGGYGAAQPRQNQLLHVVLFKCARADVYYIQEGTGLSVKPGDLVIVEADRGTDLGTVAKGNVDWQSAKDLKEHYAEEQYKWLMMYSQGAAAAHEGSNAGLLASSQGLPGSAVGGMGPQGQNHMQEPNAGEIRPKLIKRLAQNHEIHALREKEGQEAKAKRVCMQKVKEHGLNMEILDAEFQMDWKKLTFYYFADAYINFNSLVTDLFKIYKTRIWMSAINPASFASPTLGIQAPSGIGPGAVGVGQSTSNERRTNAPAHEQQGPPPPQGGRGFRPNFHPAMAAEKQLPPMAAAAGFPPNNYALGPGGYGNGPPMAPYANSVSPGGDGFPGPSFQTPGDFPPNMRQRFAHAHADAAGIHPQRVSPMPPQADWNVAFQGLSLNTH